jgi:hypothetical protein
MKVFYIDEDEVEVDADAEDDMPKRAYYVKMDNMNVPDNLKGYKWMEASSPKDLLKSVKMYYGLENYPNLRVQLWSAQMYGGTRLDIMDEIPKQYEFLWVRVLVINQG